MRYYITTSEFITRLNTYINSIGNRVGDAAWMDYMTSSIKSLRAGRILPWMKKQVTIPVFSNIFKYPLEDDFDALINAIPPLRTNYAVGQQLMFSTEKEFARIPEIGLAIGWENGEKYLLCKGTSALNDLEVEDFDGEATDYTLSGDAINPVRDDTNFLSGDASLRFDITDSTHTFTISRTIDSIDASEIFNLGTAFIEVYMPTVITSIRLRFGNDSSNYYETALMTNQYCNTSFVADWNELGSSLENATEVGTVDLTDITYIAVVGNNTGVSAKGFAVDGFFLKAGSQQVLSFNSYNIVKESAASSTWQAIVDDVNNLVLWDQDYDDLLLFKCLDKAGFFNYKDVGMVQKADADYAELFRNFENRYPSQEARNKVPYYRRVNTF